MLDILYDIILYTGMTCTEGCRNMLDQYAEQTECFRGDHLIQTKHTLRRYNFPDVFRLVTYFHRVIIIHV